MKAWKRLNEDSKAFRDSQQLMVELTMLIVAAYGAELNQTFNWGAKGVTKLTRGAMSTVRAAIKKYKDDDTFSAVCGWCRSFGFNPRVTVRSDGAIDFMGGEIEKERRPKTHYDMIHCLGVEEMAEFIAKDGGKEEVERVRKWLLSEVEDA